MSNAQIKELGVRVLGAAVPWFLEHIQDRGVELSPTSELAEALAVLEKTRLGAEAGATLHFKSSADGQRFHLRATGADFLTKALHRGLCGLEGFDGHLGGIRSGDPILTGPAGSSTTERNGTWELLLASLVSPFASNVRRGEPDILLEFQGQTIGLAAKVLYSREASAHLDTVAHGAAQLQRSAADCGFVAVNLVELFPHAAMFRNFLHGQIRDAAAAEQVLNVWVTTFIDCHNLEAWGRRLGSRSKLLSVLFFVPTVLHIHGREMPVMPYYRVHILSRPGLEERARAFEAALNESCQQVLAHVPSMPIASIMEPGSDGIATVMEPPDRQGHGATPRVGVRRIASLMEPPDRQGHGATS